MPNYVFAMGEAAIWVTPSSLASQNIGFAESASLEREDVLLEDGSASYYNDRLTIQSPWVDADAQAIFEAAGPYNAFVRWQNEDDNRLTSISVTQAKRTSMRFEPGDSGTMRFSLLLEGRSLL